MVVQVVFFSRSVSFFLPALLIGALFGDLLSRLFVPHHARLPTLPNKREKKRTKRYSIFKSSIHGTRYCNIVTFDFVAVRMIWWVRTSKPGEQEPETSPLVFSSASMATCVACRFIVHESMKKLTTK